MRRRLSVLFMVLVALAVFTSTALAAPLAVGKSVTLLSVEYNKGGIVLLFETSGLTKADLKDNSFHADSNFQDMYCTFAGGTTIVRCTVSKGLAGLGGFHATLAGFAFWGELPQARSLELQCADGEEPWYAIDVYEYGEYVDSGEIPVEIWNLFEAEGIFDLLAEELGITFEITDTFCGPDVDLEIPV